VHDHLNRLKQHTLKTQGPQAEYGGNDLLDAGLQAAKRGWRIFPCKGNKRPLVDNWDEVATTDELTISRWAKQYPGGLWGRALDADVVVIDLDIKNGKNGFADFQNLQGCKPDEFGAPRVASFWRKSYPCWGGRPRLQEHRRQNFTGHRHENMTLPRDKTEDWRVLRPARYPTSRQPIKATVRKFFAKYLRALPSIPYRAEPRS
jgi:hypothetical protein